MKVGDTVEVKPAWSSKFYDRYWGYDLHGEKGEVTEVLSHNGEIEYYRVKFPTITIWDQDNQSKVVEDFIWPFYPSDIECTTGKLEFTVRRKYRKGKSLKNSQAAAYRLRQRGMKIREIAEQLDVSLRTMKYWLQNEIQRRCKLPV